MEMYVFMEAQMTELKPCLKTSDRTESYRQRCNDCGCDVSFEIPYYLNAENKVICNKCYWRRLKNVR